MNKFGRDKEYLVLSKKLEDAKRKYPTQRAKITGVYLEIAEYMKNSLFMVDEAKENYIKVIQFGKDYPECALDSSLAYRNLAEIAVEENDLDSSIEKINKSLECAYRSNDLGIIQQALHQRSLICLSCEILDKALEYAEECKNYLNENAAQIDRLKKDGDSKCRMAHLQNLIASIYMSMDGCEKKGLEINEKAIKYASENNNWTLYYRCLHTKLNLTIGRERVQIAEMMCNIAGKVVPQNSDEKKFKREAKCHLALEKLRFCEEGNIAYAKKLLWKCFEEVEKDPESVSSDLYEQIKKGLVFVYKVKERETKANSMNVRDNAKRRKAQMMVFEKIADDATEMAMNEIALYYYQRMFKFADSVENQKRALCSMAEAAKDCGLFERAVHFYKQARAKEVELGYNSEQLLETDISIAILTAEIETISPKERLDIFEKVYAKCTQPKQKISILEEIIKFLKLHPNLCSKEEFEEKLEEEKKQQIESEIIIGEEKDDENNEKLEKSPNEDEFDAMSEGQILFELKKEMKTLDSQEKIIKERSNKNKHGESNLHEVARSDDYQLLKQLIERGYDINQLDHGGWTPLSEAVTAQKFANVRLLLVNGANPNTRSTEFLVDDDQNKITSSGLTPLMEACSFGNIDIIKILLQFKVRVAAKDDDDWTALEYLWEFLLNANGLEREKREKLERIVEIIKKKQMEEGFNPRSYEDFMDLIELKKSANRNKKKRSSGNNSLSGSKSRKSMENLDGMATTSNKSNAFIDDDDSDLENVDNAGEKDEEESEDEEVRNLEDYQKCINGLRNRSTGENPKASSIQLNRKRAAAGNSNKRSLSKKMFLVN